MSWHITKYETTRGLFRLDVHEHIGTQGVSWWPLVVWTADSLHAVSCSLFTRKLAGDCYFEGERAIERAQDAAELVADVLAQHAEPVLTLIRFFRACAGGHGVALIQVRRGVRARATELRCAP